MWQSSGLWRLADWERVLLKVLTIICLSRCSWLIWTEKTCKKRQIWRCFLPKQGLYIDLGRRIWNERRYFSALNGVIHWYGQKSCKKQAWISTFSLPKITFYIRIGRCQSFQVSLRFPNWPSFRFASCSWRAVAWNTAFGSNTQFPACRVANRQKTWRLK